MDNQQRPVREAIARWWQGWRGKFAACKVPREDKMKQMADELGLTVDELRTISAKAHYTSNLLPLRMALLRLDAAETARGRPTLFRELEMSCKLCESKGQCTWDIAEEAANSQWEKYCPNVAKLRSLQGGNAPESKSS